MPPKQHSRSKRQECDFSLFNHASSWGQLLMLISYLGLIIKGRVLLHSRSLRLISINGHGRRASMYSFNQKEGVANHT